MERRDRLRVAVTGSDGFIGNRLVSQLVAAGHHVIAVGGADQLDIRDAAGVKQVLAEAEPEVVFHLAAVSGPMVLSDQPDLVTTVNTVGTINVLEAARHMRQTRVILASSVAGYSSGSEEYPVPTSVYGVTKRFAELAADVYRKEFDVDVTSVRIGSVYGAERKTDHILHRMIHSALADQEIEYESGAWEPLVHVSDCARLLAALAAVPCWRRAYNLVTTPAFHRSLAEIIQAALPDRQILLKELQLQENKWPWRFDPGPLLQDTGTSAGITLRSGVHALLQDRMNVRLQQAEP